LKLILNLLLLFIAFLFVRRAIGQFLAPRPASPPPRRPRQEPPRQERASGPTQSIRKDEVIEDAEFEELD